MQIVIVALLVPASFAHLFTHFHSSRCNHSLEADSYFQSLQTETQTQTIDCIQAQCPDTIKKFPTFIFQHEQYGEFTYNGTYSLLQDFVDYIGNATIHSIQTEQQLNQYKKTHPILLVHSGSEQDLYSLIGKYRIGYALYPDLKQSFIFKNGAQHDIDLEDQSSIEKLIFGNIIKLDEQNVELLFKRESLIIIHDSLELSEVDPRMQVVICNTTAPITTRLMKAFNIEMSPAVRIYDGQLYSYDESQIKTSKIQSFVQKYYEGKLQPLIKSEEIPDKNFENGVRVVVAYNLKTVVGERDVFLFVYKKSCDKCIPLLDILEEVARVVRSGRSKVKPNKLMVGKVNADENEVPDVHRYPTFQFYQDGELIGIYEGDRTQEGMLKWIESQYE